MILSGQKRGVVTLQSGTTEDVFYQNDVYGRENWPDEYSMGIDLKNRQVPGRTIGAFTEAGELNELKNTRSLGGLWPYTIEHPALMVERPSFDPVSIELEEKTSLLAQYTAESTDKHVLSQLVRIYIEYEEE